MDNTQVKHEQWCNALDYHDERKTDCNCGAKRPVDPPHCATCTCHKPTDPAQLIRLLQEIQEIGKK